MKIKVLLVSALCCAVLMFGGCENISEISYPTDFDAVVSDCSEKNGLDKYTVFSIIKRESKFVHDAQSDKGAKGLMQLTGETAGWTAERIKMTNFKEDDLFDPYTNISLGCAYFAYLLTRYEGDKTLALCAYNAGPSRVDEWLSDTSCSADGKKLTTIPYEETEKYVTDILNYEEKYKQLYSESENDR